VWVYLHADIFRQKQDSTVNIFSFLYDFVNNIFSLAYFTVRIHYIIHIIYKICFNRLFLSSVRCPVNSKFWGIESYREILNYVGVSTPSVHVGLSM